MRLGLANMPLLLALDILNPSEFFLLALLKILGQGITGGMIFSHVFLFSITGTASSALIMFGLRRLLGKKYLGFAGLGCAGAMASNCVQLLMARYLIFGPALRYLAAPFLASGLVTGVTLGLVCEYFCRHSIWYAEHLSAVSHAKTQRTRRTQKKEDVIGKKEESKRLRGFYLTWNNINAELLFFTGLLMALIFLFNHLMEIRIAQFLFFCLLALVFRKKINLFATALFTGGIVFFHLLAPFGKVLFVLGPMRITQGALYAGIDKALVICGLVIVSRVCVKSDLKLPGTIGSLLGESFRMLELMRERKKLLNKKQIMRSVDQLLLEMETINLDDTRQIQEIKKSINIKSVLLLISMLLLTAVMNFIPHL